MACRRWRLSLQELEAIALPRWWFDYNFRDWQTFRNFLYPMMQEFTDGDLVSYWSTTYGAWVEAVVVGRPVIASGCVFSYDLDVKQGVLPGRIRRRHQCDPCPPDLAVDGSPKLLGEVCNISCLGPARLRCCSARWAALLDGTIVARLMTDSHPTLALDDDSDLAEEMLQGIRQIPWAPSDDWLFPWHCRRRMVFLVWIGRALGLQQVWAHVVLPLVGWIDAFPGMALAEPPPLHPADEAPDMLLLEQLWALDEETSEGSEESQALSASPERRKETAAAGAAAEPATAVPGTAAAASAGVDPPWTATATTAPPADAGFDVFFWCRNLLTSCWYRCDPQAMCFAAPSPPA